MTWMLTFTGAVIDLRLACSAHISTLDIAHSLSLINRFHGHTSRPYSVAEHSLLVVEIMERELGVHEPDALLAGLLHDAHEAYINDLAQPMKLALKAIAQRDGRNMDDYMRVETAVQADVLLRFDAFGAYSRHHKAIKQADIIALATERRDLLPATGPAWPVLESVQPVPWLRLSERAGMSWEDWRQAYVDRFGTLYTQRVEEGLEP